MVVIKIEKRHVYIFVVLVVILIGVFVINAYGTSTPSTFGHSGGEVNVLIGGQEKTLQQAIDLNDFNKGQVAYLDAPYSELRVLQSNLPAACDGNSFKTGLDLLYLISACHRWCIQRGYIGGTVVEMSCPLVGCLCVK